MMKPFFKPILSLKSQLLIYFIVVSLISTAIITGFYYFTLKSIIEKNTGENNYQVIAHILDNIDKQVDQTNRLTDWIYTDNDIGQLLKRPGARVKIHDAIKRRALANMAKQFQSPPIAGYLLSLFIIGHNGLDIRYGMEAALIDPEEFERSEWFNRDKESNYRILWVGITSNYTTITNNRYVIPMYRTIHDLNSGKKLGFSILLLKPDFFTDCYRAVLFNQGEQIYLLDGAGQIVTTNQPITPATKNKSCEFLQKTLTNEGLKYFEENINHIPSLITYKKSARTGWTLIKIIPIALLQKQKVFLRWITGILVLGVILMSVLFFFFLSGNFTKPIKLLVSQVNEIAQGNFGHPIILPIRNEIGSLGKSITKMQTDIKNLLQESIQKEEAKRIAEMKMLQSQINPHFLYNTLNSIKVMATLQGAKGIEKMAGSLGRLLKAALSELSEKIPLYEELSILDDYIFIQNIRYKGRIQFRKNISDDRLLNCSIIKFILQPIVENTILHGIEPRNEVGEVSISIYPEGCRLIIEVWDNGTGMSATTIKAIHGNINTGHDVPTDKKIGLKNIIRRIKLIYGEEYGLHFESEVGQYTKVKIILPIEYCENALTGVEQSESTDR